MHSGGGVHNGGGYAYMGIGPPEISVPFAQFFCEMKVALKKLSQ